jgi:hypothetical protein
MDAAKHHTRAFSILPEKRTEIMDMAYNDRYEYSDEEVPPTILRPADSQIAEDRQTGLSRPYM